MKKVRIAKVQRICETAAIHFRDSITWQTDLPFPLQLIHFRQTIIFP